MPDLLKKHFAHIYASHFSMLWVALDTLPHISVQAEVPLDYFPLDLSLLGNTCIQLSITSGAKYLFRCFPPSLFRSLGYRLRIVPPPRIEHISRFYAVWI